jgi:hypothetical protein
MPVICQTNLRSSPRAPNDPHHLAFCSMRSGPSGALQKSTRGSTHLLVVIDKFTKWVKAKPLAKIGSKQAIDFIQDIIFHFGVPNSIIANNGTQFTREKFLDFCDNNNIRVDWTVVAHPRTNEQIEHTNDMILQGMKPHVLTQEGEDVDA